MGFMVNMGLLRKRVQRFLHSITCVAESHREKGHNLPELSPKSYTSRYSKLEIRQVQKKFNKKTKSLQLLSVSAGFRERGGSALEGKGFALKLSSVYLSEGSLLTRIRVQHPIGFPCFDKLQSRGGEKSAEAFAIP